MKAPDAPLTFAATLRYLYGLQYRGIKFGLRTTRLLTAALGHPERIPAVIHIAGTNGKGSTAASLASILQESGHRTGLYTSPHLVRFTERIRVDGEEMPEGQIVYYTKLLQPLIERIHATFFEVVTAIAFRHFADREVDVAVVETGMGGRLDATNVVLPVLSVITTIGLDHREYLGGTITAIAREKAGIIKPAIPCVTGAEQKGVLSVFRRVAARRRARLITARDRVAVTRAAGGRLRVVSPRLGEIVFRPGLQGAFQEVNTGIVAAACDMLLELRNSGRDVPVITREAVGRGFRRVVQNTGMRGRYDTPASDRRMILDVAHNPDAIRALVQSLTARGERNLTVVFGVMKDKEFRAMLEALRPVASRLIPVRPQTSRALSTGAVRGAAERAGIRTVKGGTVAEGLLMARRIRRKKGKILVTGSHYVVGEALTALAAS